jgi:hypothetical protein
MLWVFERDCTEAIRLQVDAQGGRYAPARLAQSGVTLSFLLSMRGESPERRSH